MARPLAPMTAKIESFIRMEARGEDPNDILRKVFHLDPETCSNEEKNTAFQQMWRWRHRPDAQAIWDDEVRAVVKLCIPNAVNRIMKQLNDENGWLANKAANDVVNLAKTTSIFQSEEKALKVQIEGMPDLGSPDAE